MSIESEKAVRPGQAVRGASCRLVLSLAASILACLAPSACRKQEASITLRTSSPTFPRTAIIPRKDAFFGLHFDLHPQKSDTALGGDVTDANIRDLLNRVKPDFVQYDCKGHAGYAGYPTRVGWASPGIVKDSLAVWRSVTRELGVGLYIHYSGVWDAKAIEEHPDWARLDAAGKRDPNATSVFGPYVDKLLIPQLEEVTAKYTLDGVWADGECWGAGLDYSPAALAAWKKETGYADAPKSRADARWLEWKMFNRRAFESYLSHWIDALHAFNPNLQLTSNWMYTTFAPKPVAAKLDFLSGDYSPSLSVDRARLEARYLASTGMPWDLMAWGFDKGRDLGWSLKTPEHLEQEAAVVLMQGGAFEIYNNPTRSGRIIEPIIRQEQAVAEFCRPRQDASHKSTSVPQVALLLSSESYWDASDAVFSPSGEVYADLEGSLHALLNLHYSVDILAEHQLLPRLKEFPLVVVPDSPKLTPEFRTALGDYVRQGGRLLLLGERCARLFGPLLGAALEGAPADVHCELKSPLGPASADGVWQRVKVASAKAIAFRCPTRRTDVDGEIAATMNAVGKGWVAAVYGPVASLYYRSHHPWIKEFLGTIVARLFPEPAVVLEGPYPVDVALRRTRDSRLSVHLLNTANMPLPDRYNFAEYIPPLADLQLTIVTPTRPKYVTWVPDGGPLPWTWKDGAVSLRVPKLHIHGVIVID